MSSTESAPRPASALDAIAQRIPPAVVGPDRNAIAEVVARIGATFGPHRIVLFGSRATGTPTADSDIDLLVILDTPRRPIEEAVRIRLAIFDIATFPLDVLVRTPEQVRVALAEGDFFVSDVMTKGAVLLEAGDERMDRES